jgi:hypothetical protein
VSEPADDLTPRQHAAVLALLGRPTIQEAAAKAKVSEKTLHGWLKDPAFRRSYRRARQAQLEQTLAGLGPAAAEAVAALRQALKDGSPGVKVAAAKEILSQAVGAQAVADLAAEVEELRADLARAVANPGQTEGRTRPVSGGDEDPGGTAPPP